MDKKKFIWGLVVLALVVIVVLVVVWAISAVTNNKDNGVSLDSNPTSLIAFSQVKPTGADVAFRLPPTMEMAVEEGNSNAYIYNQGESQSRGEPVAEFKGRVVLPSGATLPSYVPGNLLGVSAKSSSLGNTAGGLPVYKYYNIGSAGGVGVAYAVDHKNGEFSFWVSERYSELPILEEMVMTTVFTNESNNPQN